LDAEEEEEELSAEKPKDIFDFKIPKESMKSEPAQQKFGNIMSQQDYANLMDSSSVGGSVAAGADQQTGGDLGAAVLGAGGLALGTMGTDAINNIFGTPSQETPSGGSVPSQSTLPKLPPTNTLPGKQHYGAPREGGRKHAGVDFDAPDNGTFYSRIGGEVIYSANAGGGYGNVVDVYNKELGVTERIAEGSKNLVKVGQTISPGTPVQQGTHQTGVFHYEIRKGRATGSGSFEGTLDPIAFLNSNSAKVKPEVAKPAPSPPSTPSTALQPAPRQPATTGSSGAQPPGSSGTSLSQRVSSSRSSRTPTYPTYNGGSATYQQGLN